MIGRFHYDGPDLGRLGDAGIHGRRRGYRIAGRPRGDGARAGVTASRRTRESHIVCPEHGFLRQTHIHQSESPERAAQIVLDFWSAIATLLREAWDTPRQHLINKGVGVYALMSIAADLYQESVASKQACERRFLMSKLSEFIHNVDWTSTGPLGGLGGETGVKAALTHIRNARSKKALRVVSRA